MDIDTSCVGCVIRIQDSTEQCLSLVRIGFIVSCIFHFPTSIPLKHVTYIASHYMEPRRTDIRCINYQFTASQTPIDISISRLGRTTLLGPNLVLPFPDQHLQGLPIALPSVPAQVIVPPICLLRQDTTLYKLILARLCIRISGSLERALQLNTFK